MTIEFIVEDGTSKENSTSYATVEEYRQYWLNRGVDYSVSSTATEAEETAADELIEGYLNAATEWIDMSYNFVGAPSDSDQASEWPRYAVYDKSGDLIDSDVIPDNLISAVCYMAAQVSDGINQIDTGVSAETYGKISKTYSGSSGIKSYPVADKLLRLYLSTGNKLMRVN